MQRIHVPGKRTKLRCNSKDQQEEPKPQQNGDRPEGKGLGGGGVTTRTVVLGGWGAIGASQSTGGVNRHLSHSAAHLCDFDKALSLL